MKISVVIPTYNSQKSIDQCLCSLSLQTHPPHEVIVVDGRSTDLTIEKVKKFQDVRLILNNQSHNPGSSRNKGAEIAVGDIIFFCDSDCIVDQKALEYHLTAYKNREDISGVMGSIHNGSPRTMVSDFIQREIMTSQWVRNLNPDGTVKYIHFGIFSFYRKEFLKRKFREDLIASEDAEFSIRISGEVKIIFEPRAVVFHRHPTTLPALFNQRKWYGAGFFDFTKYCKRETFKPDSLYYSALRYLDFPENYLYKAVFQDNRLLCKGCRIKECEMDSPRLPRQGISNKYLCRVICLGFAAGILKKRTSADYLW
ncbi:MAG: glycosyltransferase [Candidatus Hodarchaeota archaeon]